MIVEHIFPILLVSRDLRGHSGRSSRPLPVCSHSSRYQPLLQPLVHIHTMDDAQDFAECWVSNTGSNSGDAFWNNAALLLITAAVLHLCTSEPRPHLCMSLTCSPVAALTVSKISCCRVPPLAREVATAFVESVGKNERLAGSVIADMATRFFPFKDPTLQPLTATDEMGFFEQDAQQYPPAALFVSVPSNAITHLQPLTAYLAMQMINRLVEKAEGQPGGRLTRPFAFYLDEFSNVGTIPHFLDHRTLVRSCGFAFLLAIQDFGQLKRRYGDDGKDSIPANCNTHVVFAGCSLQETRFYCERMGVRTIKTITTEESGHVHSLASQFSETYGEAQRPLMTFDELRTMEDNTVIVLMDTLSPIKAQTRPYFQDPTLTEWTKQKYPFAPRTHPPVPPFPSQEPATNTQARQTSVNDTLSPS